MKRKRCLGKRHTSEQDSNSVPQSRRKTAMPNMTEFVPDQASAHLTEPLPPSAIEYLKGQRYGDAMTRLTNKRESAVERARAVGWPPFSILNFNPVWLSVNCAHVNFTV